MLIHQICKKVGLMTGIFQHFSGCADGLQFQGDHKLVGRRHRAIGPGKSER